MYVQTVYTSDFGIPATGVWPRRITFCFDVCSMLNLHVGLHVHDVLTRLTHHLRLRLWMRVRSMRHHWHLARMADLRYVALLSVRGVRCGSVLLRVWVRMLRLRWCLMAHWDAHVSLILRWVRRRVRSRCAVASHLHRLRGDERLVLERIRHCSRAALHTVGAGVRLNSVDRRVLSHRNCMVLRMRRRVRAPACIVVRCCHVHGRWCLAVW